MSKLLRFYGDTMFAIGSWFMKRGEKYATWIEFVPESGWDLCTTDDCDQCHCGECD